MSVFGKFWYKMGPEIIFFSFKSHISRIFMCLGCILIGINHFNHLEQLSWFFISWKWAKKLINSPKLVIYAALITSFLAPRTLWVLKKCFFGYPRPLTSTWSQKEQHVRTSKFPWLRTQCHTIRSLILLSLWSIPFVYSPNLLTIFLLFWLLSTISPIYYHYQLSCC